jgi:hypothetical protein
MAAKKKKTAPNPTPRMTRGRPVRRLYVVRGEGVWHLRQGRTVTDTYETRREAVDGARAIAKATKAEIFVDSYSGLYRHKVDQSPEAEEFLELLRRIHEYHKAERNGGSERE